MLEPIMGRTKLFIAAVGLIATLLPSLLAQVPGKARDPQSSPLKQVRLKSGALRPGFGFDVRPCDLVFRARVGRTQLDFHDLNSDGRLQPDVDGLSIPDVPFVVRLPASILLESGQFALEFDGVKGLILRAQLLQLPPQVIADAALFTELRIRSGLAPVLLDPALCEACVKHCDYLALNSINDGSAGMATHDEDPAKPGYTEEGARAGAGSSIGFEKSVKVALLGNYCSAWHGCPMVAEGLRTFGVAAKHGVTLVYFGRHDAAPTAVPQPFPADGATQVYRNFCESGEEPNPVPGSEWGRGCGAPIYVSNGSGMGALKAVLVKDARGREVIGTMSCPQRPANPQWPTNSGLALFLPSQPLASNTTYKVEFEFESGSLAWSFRTGTD